MERRNFLKLSSLLMLGSVNTAQALLTCTSFDERGIQQCQVGINSSLANISINSPQYQSQWCWAASISMVFRYYGYDIPQRVIVQQTWGNIVNLPSQPNQILLNLNRIWMDSYGHKFRVIADTYTANHITASQDLSQNMPLIIGTRGHAMVLTSLKYLKNTRGQGKVVSAIVRDPWPGRGRRTLSIEEWYSTSFLARIRIQPL